MLPSVAIEKLHPSFYDYDVERFNDRIAATTDRFSCPVTVVAVVREPLEAMWSMVDYKQRNPRWLADLDPTAIPELIATSIEAIARVRASVCGPVLDYRDITDCSDHFVGVVARLTGHESDAIVTALVPRWDGRDLNTAKERGFIGTPQSAATCRVPTGPGRHTVS